jgi:putative OPT family oligopeptide transporter
MAVVSDDQSLGKAPEYTPYVPEQTDLKELTIRAVVIGVLMAVVLGSANAYLGLKAGITVAATFPAAVVGMAALRLFKGSILEENVARTSGAVGEALVAGAIFTLPAFVIAGVWDSIDYMWATILMIVGGFLGVSFVILLRRTLVEESGLPFPESVAAAEIHKAGQKGGTGAQYVFGAMGLSAFIELFKNQNGFTAFKEYISFAGIWQNKPLGLLNTATQEKVTDVSLGGGYLFQTPSASPALWGVGYIIGPRLASIAFSGGLLGWGLFVPLIMLFAPGLVADLTNPAVLSAAGEVGQSPELYLANQIWFFAVRPFAVGSMLLAAAYTLFNMRKQLATGIGRAIRDLFSKSGEKEKLQRYQIDLPYGMIFSAIGILAVVMAVIYYIFSQDIVAAITAAIVMAIAGFFFAAVAGYLVGLIGSSNNPISGLTLSTLIVAALLILAFGVPTRVGPEAAILAVLGVASVVCCSCGVAGDMMQDFKVGHILGGTPWKMQVGKLFGVFFAALVLALPLIMLHEASLASGTGGIGGSELPAPQAGLMAMLSKGIINAEMTWPLVILGMVFTLGLILVKSPSPMLIAIGMYLPLHTTFAIFVGGLIRWTYESIMKRKQLSNEQKTAKDNVGTLLASGMIAGEALMAIIIAGFVFFGARLPALVGLPDEVNPLATGLISQTAPGPELGILVLLIVGAVLIMLPKGKKVD